jgi:RimJ/RimL family protein N-acetyltransferase
MGLVNDRIDALKLVIRDLEIRDSALLPQFFGPERAHAFEAAGWKDPEQFPIQEILAAVESGALEAWIVEASGGPSIAIQLYQPLPFPGVWTFEGAVSRDGAELRGAGTAAATMGLDLFFSRHPEARRVMGYVATTNIAARRVCDKLGFTEEGLARGHLELADGKRTDAWLMGLLAEEWSARDHASGSTV